MSYQNDPIGTIEADLESVEKELEVLNHVFRAANVLLATDRDRVERNKMTVQEAAQVVANADLKFLIGADFKSITLPEIVNGLGETIDNVTEERNCFVNAQNELFAWNRGQTIKWINAKLGHPDITVGQASLLNDVLEVLNNVKPKYDC